MRRTDTVFISWHLVVAATRSPDTHFLFNKVVFRPGPVDEFGWTSFVDELPILFNPR